MQRVSPLHRCTTRLLCRTMSIKYHQYMVQRVSPFHRYTIVIGASLSEPHIDRTSGRFSIYYDYISSLWYDRHPRAALGHTKIRKSTGSRPHASFTVSLEPVAVSFDIGSLQYEFYKSSTRLRYKSAMRLRSANPGIRDG